MHNKVNRLYDKPEVSYDEMLDNYKSLYKLFPDKNFCNNTIKNRLNILTLYG